MDPSDIVEFSSLVFRGLKGIKKIMWVNILSKLFVVVATLFVLCSNLKVFVSMIVRGFGKITCSFLCKSRKCL